MSKHAGYEQRTEEICQPIADEHGCELVDVEFIKEAGSWHLRVYMDKEGGISIDDLAAVSRILNEKMDELDFIDESYILEVSSPGLTRPFKKPKDYIRNLGKDVELKVFKPISFEENGKTYTAKEFVGILSEYNEDSIVVQFEKDSLEIEISNIALIRQSIDF